MKTGLLLLLVAVCASGACASHRYSCPDSNHLDTWIGKTEEDLVRKKGEPTYRQTKFNRDDTVVIAWRTVRWECPECNGPDAPVDRCAYCDPDMIEEVERYFVRAGTGRIYDWDWSGPWGEQYFSEADTQKAQQVLEPAPVQAPERTAGQPADDSDGERVKTLKWSDLVSWTRSRPDAPKRTGRCIRY